LNDITAAGALDLYRRLSGDSGAPLAQVRIEHGGLGFRALLFVPARRLPPATRIKLFARAVVQSQAHDQLVAVVEPHVGADHSAAAAAGERHGFVKGLGRGAQRAVAHGERAVVPHCGAVRPAVRERAEHPLHVALLGRGAVAVVEQGQSAHRGLFSHQRLKGER
jgi:hypothetical protein